MVFHQEAWVNYSGKQPYLAFFLKGLGLLFAV
jgi:hypothetical protein